MPSQRLDKTIAGSGPYTRSQAAELIRGGRVTVDGRVAGSASEKCDPGSAQVSIDGAPLVFREFRYVMMNKPCGYVSSTEDRREKTVMELLDDSYSGLGLFPAGRLDKDAEGLLLLTNDGGLAHDITSPGRKVSKRYYIEFDGAVTDADAEAFSGGLLLGDGTKCLPAALEPAPGGAYVTLWEGKYHQVKRMMAALGKPVKYIKRLSIGGLALDEGLEPGEYCEITDDIHLLLCNK